MTGDGRSGAFSVERLMDFLRALGQDVEITVRPTRKDQGEVSVVVAQGGMKNRPIENDGMPDEIDFSGGVRGLHRIPPHAEVFLPASFERSVWQYFSGKAEQKGMDLSELLTEVLQRDIEINEALPVVPIPASYSICTKTSRLSLVFGF